jgi:putative membrane protein
MGSADVVPGVSGGTVALVFGIYQRLIDAIRTGSRGIGHLVKGDVRGFVERMKAVEWRFLIPLVAGILTAVVALSGLIEHLLENEPVRTSGAFLGLVAGSVIVAWQLLNVRDGRRLGVLLAVSVITFVLLGLKEGTSEATVGQADDANLVVFFLAGAIAICAMILPGISGSFLLVTMGLYGPVLAAVNDREIVTVVVFTLGCVVGLGLFSQVLHWALSTHYDTVMAALIGLMLGSLRVVWPWPSGVDSTAIDAPSDPIWSTVLLAVAGVVVVLAFNEIGKRFEHRTTEAEAAELRSV